MVTVQWLPLFCLVFKESLGILPLAESGHHAQSVICTGLHLSSPAAERSSERDRDTRRDGRAEVDERKETKWLER